MNEKDPNPLSSNGNGISYGHHQLTGEFGKNKKDLFDSESMNDMDLQYLTGILLRYKWWVLGITLLCLGAAIYLTELIQPIYQSSGTILITQEQTRYPMSGTDLSNMMSSSFGVGMGSRITNEMEILQSRNLSSEIATRILEERRLENGELFPILWTEYPKDSTIVTSAKVSQRIQNSMELKQTDEDTDVIRITYSSFSPLEVKRLVDVTMDTYTEVSADQKRKAANSALAFLEGERESVQNRLNAAETALRDYRRSTNLVQVDGQTNAVIDRLAELESQRQQLQVKRVSVNSSIESYENQLEQIRPGLAEQFAENISGRLESAQLRLAELRTQQSLMIQRNPGLRNNPQAEPQFIQNQKEIETVRSEIRDITNNLLNADDSDVYIGFLEQEDGGITNRILELRSDLIQLKIEESQLNAQEQVIEQRMEEEGQFFDGLPDNMLDLARFQREVQIQEKLFTTISSQYAEMQLWEQTQFGAGNPIDYGYIPESPTSPNRLRYALFGLIVGGIISFGFIFSRDVFNKTIDGMEKLKATGYPLLAIIPNFENHIKHKYDGKSFVTVRGNRVSTSWETLLDSVSPISESYRRLQNNIVYSDPDKQNQTILVTSSRKGEGKTTVSLNLAVSLAEGGKKVVVVDSDLRRSNIHLFTGEAREPGIKDIFYNNTATKAAIKPTLASAVHVITAGDSIPNPAAVMQSRKLRYLLQELKDHYDHIIVDTPPYGVLTDAAPLMQHADGIILVARFGLTQTYELDQTVENLQRIKANVLGTVLTSYKHRKSAEYYYYNYKYSSYDAYEDYQEK